MTPRNVTPGGIRTARSCRTVAVALCVSLAAVVGVLVTPTAAGATPTGRAATSCATKANATRVMRSSQVTAGQLLGWYQSKGKTNRATATMEQLANYYVQEGADEGVAGDVAFAQSIIETGYFSTFSSRTPPTNNNFAGLGAVDGGSASASFPDARTGVRAQIQHLRAYGDPTATTANLAHPLVDGRFGYVSPKGKAPYWEQFGNGTWASDSCYATKVLDVYANIQAWAAAHPVGTNPPPSPYAPFTTSDDLVRRGYQDLALREPTSAEVNGGNSTLRNAQPDPDAFLASIVDGDSADHIQPVARLYLGALGRSADRGGLAFWAAKHRSGTLLVELARQIVGSPEFRQKYGVPSDPGFVDLIYGHIMGRAPDAGGQQYWVDKLRSGTSRAQVVRDFTESPEYRQKSEALVETTVVYLGMLRRLPDSNVNTWWTSKVSAGAAVRDLVAKVRASDEYARLVG